MVFEIVLWCFFFNGNGMYEENIKGNSCESRKKGMRFYFNDFYEYIYIYLLCICIYRFCISF